MSSLETQQVQHEVVLPCQSDGGHAVPDHLPHGLRPHRLLHDGPANGNHQTLDVCIGEKKLLI